MNLKQYEKQFQEILDGNNASYPYDSEEYINYVKLNSARVRRWKKTGKITPELAKTVQSIKSPQHWLLITEPWCGDAANSQVFIGKAALLNSKISLTVQNRDAADSEIGQYLTNGGKSVPKLIVRDEQGNDLFTWGPRPKEAQVLAMNLMNDDSLDMEEKKAGVQNWYNQDKGQSMQKELNELLKKAIGAI